LTPGFTKCGPVTPSTEMPTDTITERLKCERMRSIDGRLGYSNKLWRHDDVTDHTSHGKMRTS